MRRKRPKSDTKNELSPKRKKLNESQDGLSKSSQVFYPHGRGFTPSPSTQIFQLPFNVDLTPNTQVSQSQQNASEPSQSQPLFSEPIESGPNDSIGDKLSKELSSTESLSQPLSLDVQPSLTPGSVLQEEPIIRARFPPPPSAPIERRVDPFPPNKPFFPVFDMQNYLKSPDQLTNHSLKVRLNEYHQFLSEKHPHVLDEFRKSGFNQEVLEKATRGWFFNEDQFPAWKKDQVRRMKRSEDDEKQAEVDSDDPDSNSKQDSQANAFKENLPKPAEKSKDEDSNQSAENISNDVRKESRREEDNLQNLVRDGFPVPKRRLPTSLNRALRAMRAFRQRRIFMRLPSRNNLPSEEQKSSKALAETRRDNVRRVRWEICPGVLHERYTWDELTGPGSWRRLWRRSCQTCRRFDRYRFISGSAPEPSEDSVKNLENKKLRQTPPETFSLPERIFPKNENSFYSLGFHFPPFKAPRKSLDQSKLPAELSSVLSKSLLDLTSEYIHSFHFPSKRKTLNATLRRLRRRQWQWKSSCGMGARLLLSNRTRKDKTPMCTGCGKTTHSRKDCPDPIDAEGLIVTTVCFSCIRTHLPDTRPVEKIPVCSTCGESGHEKHRCPKTKCFKCKQFGHWRSGCPMRQEMRAQQRNIVCRGCGRVGHIQPFCPRETCTYCKRKGHWKKECPKRKGLI